jgi:hypothetical protein
MPVLAAQEREQQDVATAASMDGFTAVLKTVPAKPARREPPTRLSLISENIADLPLQSTSINADRPEPSG